MVKCKALWAICLFICSAGFGWDQIEFQKQAVLFHDPTSRPALPVATANAIYFTEAYFSNESCVGRNIYQTTPGSNVSKSVASLDCVVSLFADERLVYVQHRVKGGRLALSVLATGADAPKGLRPVSQSEGGWADRFAWVDFKFHELADSKGNDGFRKYQFERFFVDRVSKEDSSEKVNRVTCLAKVDSPQTLQLIQCPIEDPSPSKRIFKSYPSDSPLLSVSSFSDLVVSGGHIVTARNLKAQEESGAFGELLFIDSTTGKQAMKLGGDRPTNYDWDSEVFKNFKVEVPRSLVPTLGAQGVLLHENAISPGGRRSLLQIDTADEKVYRLDVPGRDVQGVSMPQEGIVLIAKPLSGQIVVQLGEGKELSSLGSSFKVAEPIQLKVPNSPRAGLLLCSAHRILQVNGTKGSPKRHILAGRTESEWVKLAEIIGLRSADCMGDSLVYVAEATNLFLVQDHSELNVLAEDPKDEDSEENSNIASVLSLSQKKNLREVKSSETVISQNGATSLFHWQGTALKLSRRPFVGTQFSQVRARPIDGANFIVWLNDDSGKAFSSYVNTVKAGAQDMWVAAASAHAVPQAESRFMEK